jgi:zinc knuckle protein
MAPPAKDKGKTRDPSCGPPEARDPQPQGSSQRPAPYESDPLDQGTVESLDQHANLLALQRAQVKSQIETKAAQKQIEKLEAVVAQLLQNNPATPRASQEPQAGPGSQYTGRYKPKRKDPPRFSGQKDGTVEYRAWKEQVTDKIRIDSPQFDSDWEIQSFIFDCTEGEAQQHLYPRYTSDAENDNPYIDYTEMLTTLDDIYRNRYHKEDSRAAYRELCMKDKEPFQDFKTRFLQLANGGRIPEADRFDDMYEKLTAPLQSRLLAIKYDLDGDFQRLCDRTGRIDADLRRFNSRLLKDREARAAIQPPPARPTPGRPPLPKPLNQVGGVPPPAPGWLPRPKPTNPQPATSPPQARQETRCFNCGGIGHLRADCKLPNRAADVKDIETDETGDLGTYETAIYGDDVDNSDPGKGEA